ncbi:MAG TPA: SpoIID/LytB domain-containing protein, partial [Phycisphaeraceae bacterium]
RSFTPPLLVYRHAGRFILQDGHQRSMAWALPRLRVEAASGDGLLSIDGHRYPDAVVLAPQEQGDRFDVINHVPLERYLPGVLERELYGQWHPEAFVAQAVAARSYALFERQLHAQRAYDLESTTASQVYRGAATNPKAVEAVQRTRGMVLVHAGRIVPAFFSSCCGGTGQAASAAFPRLASAVDIPPLRGARCGGWCQASPNYRWGPILRDTSMLAKRIAAWGRANRHPVAQLEGLRDIRISELSGTGRPAAFVIIDRRGRRFTLPAESFRFACNYAGAGLPAVEPAQQLKSSHVRVRLTGRTVRFEDGRGHGHGVGLCQWGAQGMAQQGYDGLAIVRFYYPGATIQRIY